MNTFKDHFKNKVYKDLSLLDHTAYKIITTTSDKEICDLIESTYKLKRNTWYNRLLLRLKVNK